MSATSQVSAWSRFLPAARTSSLRSLLPSCEGTVLRTRRESPPFLPNMDGSWLAHRCAPTRCAVGLVARVGHEGGAVEILTLRIPRGNGLARQRCSWSLSLPGHEALQLL